MYWECGKIDEICINVYILGVWACVYARKAVSLQLICKVHIANIASVASVQEFIPCLWSELRSPLLLPFEAKSQLASPC